MTKIFSRTTIAFFAAGILLYLLYWISILNGPPGMQSEIHYIPEGFIGNVYIFHNIKNGEPRERENGNRIYNIPQSGILKTKFSPNVGVMQNDDIVQFYYVDGSGKIKEKIPSYIFLANYDSINTKNYIGIFGYNIISSTIERKDYSYLKYTVDTLSLFDKKHNNESQKDYQIIKYSIQHE
ncbi:MAG TPA: hypothetical protein VFG10_11850 [Saprospiraceae bacterium]|nr:hypothetical protein [Saprospiraceae bacterium]